MVTKNTVLKIVLNKMFLTLFVLFIGLSPSLRAAAGAASEEGMKKKFRIARVPFGDTVWHAALSGDAAAVKCLVSAGGDKEHIGWNMTTPLVIAAVYGHAPVVAALIELKADVDSADTNGMTALYHAAQAGNEIMSTLLIAADADTDNAETYHATTPIMAARNQGHMHIVQLIEEARRKKLSK